MSTDMHHLKVLEKDDLTVTLRVYNVYYDHTESPAPSPQFFLLLLTSYYGTGTGTPLWDALFPPLADEEDVPDDYAYESDLTAMDFRERVAPRYIREVEQLGAHNFPLSETAPFNGQPWDGNYDSMPYTDYRVTVTDARWTQHLTPGQDWGTTYDDETDF